MVGGPERAPFEHPQRPVDDAGSVGEPGFVQLGAKVMVIEDEVAAADEPEEKAEGPEDVRRVAGL